MVNKMRHSLVVQDHMSAALVTFTPDMDVTQAIHLLLENHISGGPVTDKLGNVVGFLSERDCMEVALRAAYHEEKGGRVEQYMTPNAVTVEADQNVLEVAQIFRNTSFNALPVLEDNRLVGSIRRADVLKAFQSIR
jgi:CBS domain-containing protein